MKLFADYRNTFKPAAFDFSLAENEGVLEPETAQSIEGGVKLRGAGGRLDVEASAFRCELGDAQYYRMFPRALRVSTALRF